MIDNDPDDGETSGAARQAVEASPARSTDSRVSTSTARTGASATTADSRITSLSQLGRVDDYLHARLGFSDDPEAGRPRLRGVEALLAFLDGEEEQEVHEDTARRATANGTHNISYAGLEAPWRPAEERVKRPDGSQAVGEQPQEPDDLDGARTPPARIEQSTSRSYFAHDPSRSPSSQSASSPPARRRPATKQRRSSPHGPYRTSGTIQSHSPIPHESLHVHLQAAQDDVARLRRELDSVQSLMHELRAEQHTSADMALPRPSPRVPASPERVDGRGLRADGASEIQRGDPLGPVMATQADMLDFVRRVDGLVWMTQEGKSRARPDAMVFEKGNLDHVLWRVTAWEGAIRRKR